MYDSARILKAIMKYIPISPTIVYRLSKTIQPNPRYVISPGGNLIAAPAIDVSMRVRGA